MVCGVMAGCALLAKTTAVFLAPIFGIFVLVNVVLDSDLGIDPRAPWLSRLRVAKRRQQQLVTAVYAFVVIGLLTLLVVNLGYGFQGSFQPLCRGHC